MDGECVDWGGSGIVYSGCNRIKPLTYDGESNQPDLPEPSPFYLRRNRKFFNFSAFPADFECHSAPTRVFFWVKTLDIRIISLFGQAQFLGTHSF